MKNIKIQLNTCLIIVMFGFPALVHAQSYPFELTKLPYSYDALEPVIDAATMEIHYSKHHAAYVNNLNAAVKGTEFEKLTLEDLMLNAGKAGEAIRNNGGGHYNHTLFWNILAQGHPFRPESEIGKAVIETFGSADSLKRLLAKAGAGRFGSGWAWLYVTTEGRLAVCSTPNQDNPIMDVSPARGVPVLCIDVWEHAYYLKYQNRRGDYLGAIMNIINWDAVDKNYTDALSGRLLKTIKEQSPRK